MKNIEEFMEIINYGFQAVKKTKVNKKKSKELLETIRTAMSKENDIFKIWDIYDEQVGRAYGTELQPILIELRDRFEVSIIQSEIERLEEIFKHSRNEGWREWLSIIAEAVSYFRLKFCIALCEKAFLYPAQKSKIVEKLKNAIKLAQHQRWAESYYLFEFLARHDFLSKETRAKLLTTQGQIQLFHFLKSEKAKELLDKAEQLSPNEGRVLCGIGEYWLNQKQFEKALPYFERSIEIEAEASLSYTGMGEYYEKLEELDEAEKWYKDAIEKSCGNTAGYMNLLNLYGRKEYFSSHESDIPTLVQQASKVTTEGIYSIYISAGYVYQINNRFEDAHIWYDFAIKMDETRLGGYISKGECYAIEGNFEQALVNFQTAIQLAPEAVDGYLKLAWLYEDRMIWEDALEWYKKCIPLRPEWEGLIRSKIGEMNLKLLKYKDAKKELIKALKIDNNDLALKVIHDLADTYYRNLNDTEAAQNIFDDILQILGESYKARYYNRIGVMKYYFDKNVEAIEAYGKAIDIEPETAVFHSNLALAYRNLKNWDRAEEELKLAYEIDNNIDDFNKEMSILLNARGNQQYHLANYKEAIEDYQQAVEFDSSDDIIYSNLGGAWESLNETGRWFEAIDNAINAYQSAYKIEPDIRYENNIKSLKQKKEFAKYYGEEALDWKPVVTPIVVEVAADLTPYMEGDMGSTMSVELERNTTEMRERIFNQFGVKIPGIRYRGNETDLSYGSYLIMINEIPVEIGYIIQGKRFFPGPPEELNKFDIDCEIANNPQQGDEGCWIDQNELEKMEKNGFELWNVVEYIIRHLETVIRKNLMEFIGHQEIMNNLKTENIEIYEELKNNTNKITAFTAVCRALVSEEAPIKPIGKIYEKFDKLYSKNYNPVNIVEKIRSIPEIRSNLSGNGKKYSFFQLGKRFEKEFKNSICKENSHQFLALEPIRCQDFLNVVRDKIEGDNNFGLVVQSAELRPFIKLFFELEYPDIQVLSRKELMKDFDNNIVGEIELEVEPERKTRNFIRNRIKTINDVPAKADESEKIAINVFVPDNITVELANADDMTIEEMFELMRAGLFYELGIFLPEVHLEIDDNLGTDEFRFQLNNLQLPVFKGLKKDESLVNDTVDRLRVFNIKGKEAINPVNGSECTIVQHREEILDKLRSAGLMTWGPAGFLVLTLASEIRKNAAMFQTIKVTKYILDFLRVSNPDLIDTALKQFSVEKICCVARDLLDEDISVRDFKNILESMLSIRGTSDIDLIEYIVFFSLAEKLCLVSENKELDDLSIIDYSNFVRMSFKKYISNKYAGGSNTLTVYLLDPELERRISYIDEQPLSDDEYSMLKKAFSDKVGHVSLSVPNPVILTTLGIRRKLRKLIEKDISNLPVLCYQELSPEINMQAIDRISWY